MILHETIEAYDAAGARATSTRDLLALVLAPSCRAPVDPVALATAIINRFADSRDGLYCRAWWEELNFRDLLEIPGMNKARAVAVTAAIGLARKVQKTPRARVHLNESRKIADYFSFISELSHEEFWAAFLDYKNQLVGARMISRGNIAAAPVNIKEIGRWALRYNTPGIILVHNHPTGDPTPSKPDINLTWKAQKLSECIDCRVLDHVIIGRGGDFYSFFDNDNM